jgi:hypothetical protein
MLPFLHVIKSMLFDYNQLNLFCSLQMTTVLLTSMVPLICAREVGRYTTLPQAQELYSYIYITMNKIK